MDLTIKPGAATEDAVQIETIVGTIDRCMQELETVIKTHIPEGVDTDWSNDFRESWENLYNNSIQGAMDGMNQSAISLKRAVAAALQYNK